MPKRGKDYLITTERHELIVVRSGRLLEARGFCRKCNGDVDYMSFDAAAGYSGLTGRDIVRKIESGDVHSSEMDGGRFAICMRSLEKEKEYACKDEN